VTNGPSHYQQPRATWRETHPKLWSRASRPRGKDVLAAQPYTTLHPCIFPTVRPDRFGVAGLYSHRARSFRAQHLARDAGCRRGACCGCLRETGVTGRVWPWHCRDSFIAESGSLLPGTNQQPPSTRTLVIGAGETDAVDPSPGPLGRPATLAAASRAGRSTAEAAGKQAGEQTCRYAAA
jgi:hypothetical protein